MRGLIALMAASCAAVEPAAATRPVPVLTGASAAAAATALAAWADEARPSPSGEADLLRLEAAVVEIDTLLRLGVLDEAGRRWEDAVALRKGIGLVDRRRLGPRMTAAERRLHVAGMALLERLAPAASAAAAATAGGIAEH